MFLFCGKLVKGGGQVTQYQLLVLREVRFQQAILEKERSSQIKRSKVLFEEGKLTTSIAASRPRDSPAAKAALKFSSFVSAERVSKAINSGLNELIRALCCCWVGELVVVRGGKDGKGEKKRKCTKGQAHLPRRT